MKRILSSSLCAIGIVILAASTAAFGQAKPAPKPPAGAQPAPAGAGGTTRVKNYDFEADNIDGELVKPEGEFMSARKTAEHGSLIRIRENFIKEIVKSAEDL